MMLRAIQGDTASTVTPRSTTSEALVWVGVLLLVTILGGLAILWYRRRVLAREEASAQDAGAMESLRKMRDSGRMTQEEFDAVRRAMIAKIKSRRGSEAGLAPRRGRPSDGS